MKQLLLKVTLVKLSKTLEFEYNPNQHATFSDITKYLTIGFELKRLACIGITYLDNDNDTITVSSDEEWALALETFTTSGNSKFDLIILTRLKSDEERQLEKENKRQEKLNLKQTRKLEKIQNKLERKERKIIGKISKHQSVEEGVELPSNRAIPESSALPEPVLLANSNSEPSAPPLPPKLTRKVEKLAKKMDKIQERLEEKQSKMVKKEMKLKAQIEHKNTFKDENEKIARDDIELYDATTQEFQHNLPPHIQYIYIDANNMLYITYALRTIVLFNKDKLKGENLLIYIARLFQGHLQVMLGRPSICFHICFDSSSTASNRMNVVNGDDTFVVSSAQDFGFEIADDMLADLATKHNIDGNAESCLFVTSDRGLRKRLKEMNAQCVGSGQWLKFCYFHLCGETANIDINQWMMQLQNEMQ